MDILETWVFGFPPLWCKRCGKFKPVEQFLQDKKGAEYWCLDCRNEAKKLQKREKRLRERRERECKFSAENAPSTSPGQQDPTG